MPLDGTLYEPEDEVLRTLHAAQERIRDPENWCQRSLQRVTVEGVIQWCALGAMYMDKNKHMASPYLRDSAYQMGYPTIATLNNRTNHPTVMAMFDRAQELRRAEIMEEAHA